MKKIIEQYKLIIIAVGVLLIVIFFVFERSKENDFTSDNLELSMPNESKDFIEKAENEGGSDKKLIIVDVKGEVVNPGIYEARPGDRIQDLITSAGGFQKRADQTQVNLAQKVKDEMVIYVPKIGEQTNNSTTSSSTINFSNEQEKVNINTAGSEELQTISGIGPSKAAAIIEYREQKGLFGKIEDIKNVTGIGDKTFEKLKELITVD
ncbi:helix-hairpin-helix domain-containing protein [Heyndrickxia sp. NPDC080065]|uniref:helix-hairpin-helix domain-containing protein n=1 Tax=Heyndrickxia sp. NPDC080065 TaxID=3390568 RepID=UPI003CFFCDA3